MNYFDTIIENGKIDDLEMKTKRLLFEKIIFCLDGINETSSHASDKQVSKTVHNLVDALNNLCNMKGR